MFTKKGKRTKIFAPLLLLLLYPGRIKLGYGIRDEHPGSATLLTRNGTGTVNVRIYFAVKLTLLSLKSKEKANKGMISREKKRSSTVEVVSHSLTSYSRESI